MTIRRNTTSQPSLPRGRTRGAWRWASLVAINVFGVVAACGATENRARPSGAPVGAQEALVPGRPLATLTPASSPNPGSTTNATSSATAPARVAVVGDSLTVASQSMLEDALRSFGATSVEVDAVEGRRMVGSSEGRPPGIEAVRKIIASGFTADLWVIELGTNDVGDEVHAQSFRSDVESILSLLPPATPVVWVNVYVGHHVDATDEANDIIAAVAANRPNMSIADWHSVADNKPELLTDDGVHLRRPGQVAYSLVIAGAVGASTDG